MTDNENKPAAALEWKSFDSPPPDGTEIVWKDQKDQIGTGYYCAEDAEYWKGFWMTAHELVSFSPKVSAVPKQIADAMKKIAEALAYRSDAQAHQAYLAIKALLAAAPQAEEANSRAEDWEHAALLASRENQALRAQLAAIRSGLEGLRWAYKSTTNYVERQAIWRDEALALLEKPE